MEESKSAYEGANAAARWLLQLNVDELEAYKWALMDDWDEEVQGSPEGMEEYLDSFRKPAERYVITRKLEQRESYKLPGRSTCEGDGDPTASSCSQSSEGPRCEKATTRGREMFPDTSKDSDRDPTTGMGKAPSCYRAGRSSHRPSGYEAGRYHSDDVYELVKDDMEPYSFNETQQADKEVKGNKVEMFKCYNERYSNETGSFEEINNELAMHIGATLEEGNGDAVEALRTLEEPVIKLPSKPEEGSPQFGILKFKWERKCANLTERKETFLKNNKTIYHTYLQCCTPRMKAKLQHMEEWNNVEASKNGTRLAGLIKSVYTHAKTDSGLEGQLQDMHVIESPNRSTGCNAIGRNNYIEEQQLKVQSDVKTCNKEDKTGVTFDLSLLGRVTPDGHTNLGVEDGVTVITANPAEEENTNGHANLRVEDGVTVIHVSPAEGKNTMSPIKKWEGCLEDEVKNLLEAVQSKQQNINVFCCLWRLTKKAAGNSMSNIMTELEQVHELISCLDASPSMKRLVSEAGTIIKSRNVSKGSIPNSSNAENNILVEDIAASWIQSEQKHVVKRDSQRTRGLMMIKISDVSVSWHKRETDTSIHFTEGIGVPNLNPLRQEIETVGTKRFATAPHNGMSASNNGYNMINTEASTYIDHRSVMVRNSSTEHSNLPTELPTAYKQTVEWTTVCHLKHCRHSSIKDCRSVVHNTEHKWTSWECSNKVNASLDGGEEGMSLEDDRDVNVTKTETESAKHRDRDGVDSADGANYTNESEDTDVVSRPIKDGAVTARHVNTTGIDDKADKCEAHFNGGTYTHPQVKDKLIDNGSDLGVVLEWSSGAAKLHKGHRSATTPSASDVDWYNSGTVTYRTPTTDKWTSTTDKYCYNANGINTGPEMCRPKNYVILATTGGEEEKPTDVRCYRGKDQSNATPSRSQIGSGEKGITSRKSYQYATIRNNEIVKATRGTGSVVGLDTSSTTSKVKMKSEDEFDSTRGARIRKYRSVHQDECRVGDGVVRFKHDSW